MSVDAPSRWHIVFAVPQDAVCTRPWWVDSGVLTLVSSLHPLRLNCMGSPSWYTNVAGVASTLHRPCEGRVRVVLDSCVTLIPGICRCSCQRLRLRSSRNLTVAQRGCQVGRHDETLIRSFRDHQNTKWPYRWRASPVGQRKGVEMRMRACGGPHGLQCASLVQCWRAPGGG